MPQQNLRSLEVMSPTEVAITKELLGYVEHVRESLIISQPDRRKNRLNQGRRDPERPRKLLRPLDPDDFADNEGLLNAMAQRISYLQFKAAMRAQEKATEQGKLGTGFRLMSIDQIKETILGGEYFYLHTPEGHEASFYAKKIGDFRESLMLSDSKKKNITTMIGSGPIVKIGGLTIGSPRILLQFPSTLKFPPEVIEGTALENIIPNAILVCRTFDDIGRVLKEWLGYSRPYTKEELLRDWPEVHNAYYVSGPEGPKEDDLKNHYLRFPGGGVLVNSDTMSADDRARIREELSKFLLSLDSDTSAPLVPPPNEQ
jgi:hypothetical protein